MKGIAKRIIAASGILAIGIAIVSTVIGVTAAGFENSKSMGQYTKMKRVIYLDTSQAESWRASSPKFAVYGWAKTAGGVDDPETLTPGFLNDAFMTEVGTNLYATTVPAECNYVIFTRHPSSVTHPSFDYGNSKIWNQTKDLSLAEDVNCFTVYNTAISGGIDDGNFNGEWEIYVDGEGHWISSDIYEDYEYSYESDD